MEIFSVLNNRTYEVRKMTVEEKVKYYRPMYHNIKSADLLTSEQMQTKMEVINNKMNSHCYIHENQQGAIVFSEYDKGVKWFPVPEQLSLF